MTNPPNSFYKAYQETPAIQKIIKVGGSAATIALVALAVGAIFLYFFSSGTMHIAGIASLGLSGLVVVTPMIIGAYVYFRGAKQEEKKLKLVEEQSKTAYRERQLYLTKDSQQVAENLKRFKEQTKKLEENLMALGCANFEDAKRNRGRGLDQGSFSITSNKNLNIKHNENQPKLKQGDYIFQKEEDITHIVYLTYEGNYRYCNTKSSNANLTSGEGIEALLGSMSLT